MHRFFAAALVQERLRDARVSASIGDNLLLNRAVEIMFELATCQSGCHGGDHVLESLLGRVVNQVVASIMIDAAGLHDEALGLIRGIGEITNLLALFQLDPPSFRAWTTSSDEERRKRFSPIKVRLAIDKHDLIAVPMDQQAYNRLCERYIHVNPTTSPNSHEGDGLKHVGGYGQASGTATFQEELTYIVAQATLLGTSMLGRQDLLQELSGLVTRE